jgi:carbon storage regulator
MLVLTRKIDESIIIGDNINIKILALSGSQVKIGISAPRSLRILRKEVHDQILSGKRRDAAKSEPGSGVPGQPQPEPPKEAPSQP